MESKSTEALVRELADKDAIRELAARYADCIWRRDADGAADLFTEDGVMDTGERQPIEGREALRKVYRLILADSDLQPFVHNHVIDLDGDTATGRCYLDLRGVLDGKSMVGSGYYHDGYARVDGDWKFSSRKLTMTFFVPMLEGWAETGDDSRPWSDE